MNQIDRGVKRRCGSCEAPFYDMLRYPVTCPKCGAVFDPTAGKKKLASVPRPPKTRTPKAAFGAAAKAAAKPAPKPVEAEEPAAEVAEEEALDDVEGDGDEVEEADDDEAEDEAEDVAEPVEDDGDDNVTGDH
jgi:uncharacterized protein (TIGR02300 family)